MTKWSANSWRKYKALHIPEYPDQEKLSQVEKQLASYPPLVFAGEARELKRNLGKVSDRKAFLLQGDDGNVALLNLSLARRTLW